MDRFLEDVKTKPYVAIPVAETELKAARDDLKRGRREHAVADFTYAAFACLAAANALQAEAGREEAREALKALNA